MAHAPLAAVHARQADEEPQLQRKIKMAIDIAAGMAYLEEHNHVHRVRGRPAMPGKGGPRRC